MHTHSYLYLVNINSQTKIYQIQSVCYLELSGNKVLTSIMGHNSVTNLRKITGNYPNPDLVNINVYTKFGQILSICSKDVIFYQSRVITLLQISKQ